MNVEAVADLLPEGALLIGDIRIAVYLTEEGDRQFMWDIDGLDFVTLIGILESVKLSENHSAEHELEEEDDD